MDRLWPKVDKDGPAPAIDPSLGSCWIWIASLTSHGYGQLGVRDPKQRMAKVHVLLWELENGPKPSGLELDHLCRVRRCVRPSHLELVTHAENMRRSGEYRRQETCKRGHPLSGDNLRIFASGGRCCLTCSRKGNLRRYREKYRLRQR